MAKHVMIKFKDGTKEIHFDGVTGDSYTLCGHDTAGDKEWSEAIKTKEKVDCDQCIAIVNHCHTISRKEFQS